VVRAARDKLSGPNPLRLRASQLPTPGSSASANAASGRTIGRALTLRHEAFEPELAGMFKDKCAVFLNMLIELNPRSCT
jgi:hypothetical protein